MAEKHIGVYYGSTLHKTSRLKLKFKVTFRMVKD